MISRVAEHCYWMSRYLERAENTARVLEVNQTLLLDLDIPVEQQWKPLLIISGIHDKKGAIDAEAVQEYMTWESENASSVVSLLASARENARIIREVISADMWERMNFYYLWIQANSARKLYKNNRSEFYCQIKRINQLIHGIGMATMAHGEAWEFYGLGMYLERACQTARILDVKYHILLPTPQHIGTPIDNVHWVAILTSCSGYEPYHKQRLSQAEPGVSVPDFLIFDALFPRSVLRCLRQSQASAYAISGREIDRPENKVEILLHELVEWLNGNRGDDFVRSGLHEALTRVVNSIHKVGDAVHTTYFDVGPQTPPVPAGSGRPNAADAIAGEASGEPADCAVGAYA
jgi:uncharacterized alpha-E superfamily protein